MICIFAEKPDMGTKFAAALDGIDIGNKKVSFDELSKYEKQIKAKRSKDGFFKINYNGQDAVVTWGYGHICSLRELKDYDESYKNWNNIPLPFIREKYDLVVDKEKKGQYNIIKRLFNEADLIICATDDDREGDLIFYNIYSYMKCKTPFKRALFNKQSKEEFIKAFKNESLVSSRDRENIMFAGKARSEGDFITGMNMTVAYSLKANNGVCSAGRVQTPVLNMIVEREKEIANFKSEKFWNIDATFATLDDEEYTGRCSKERLKSKEEAQKIIDSLPKMGEVASVEKKKQEKQAPHLYSLQTLQMDANKLYGFSLDKTLSIAQELYEQGYTTYPRTDSVHLTEDMETEVVNVLSVLFTLDEYKCFKRPINISSKNKYYFDNNKVESHSAIIPTTKSFTQFNGSNDTRKIYDLICKSVLCMVFPNVVFNKTSVKTLVGDYEFISNGSEIIEKGFYVVTGLPKESILPNLSKGDMVEGLSYEIKEGQTEPPKRYTDSSLLKAMINCGKYIDDEELKKIMASDANGKPRGIGRPSSQASIVKTLETRAYTKKSGKSIVPTDKGINFIENLPVDEMKSAEMTARWELRLDNIAKGTDSYEDFISDLESTVERWVKQVQETQIENQTSDSKDTLNCPICKKPLNRFSWGYGCSGYKDEPPCKFAIGTVASKKLTDNQIKSLIEGKQISVKGFTSKAKKKFDADLKMDTSTGKLEFVFNN